MQIVLKDFKTREEMQQFIESNHKNDGFLESVNEKLNAENNEEIKFNFLKLLENEASMIDQMGQAFAQQALKERNMEDYDLAKDIEDLSAFLWDGIIATHSDYMEAERLKNIELEIKYKEDNKNNNIETKVKSFIEPSIDFDDDIPF